MIYAPLVLLPKNEKNKCFFLFVITVVECIFLWLSSRARYRLDDVLVMSSDRQVAAPRATRLSR